MSLFSTLINPHHECLAPKCPCLHSPCQQTHLLLSLQLCYCVQLPCIKYHPLLVPLSLGTVLAIAYSNSRV